MKIKQQFIAGFFFAVSAISWCKAFYWHFDQHSGGAFVAAGLISFVISIALLGTDD